MKWCLLILLNLISFLLPGQNRLPPIGLWREHLLYHSAIDVTVSDNKVYCVTPFSLFSVDLTTNEVECISSFWGTATNSEETKNNVLVFPNPVPSYNGNIGIGIYRKTAL